MLLSLLHETITKRAKTVEELQKLLDMYCANLKATSATVAEVIDPSATVYVKEMSTPGTLPFTVQGRANNAIISIPSLRNFDAFKLLETKNLSFSGPGNPTGALESVSFPHSVKSFTLGYACPKLKTLEGLKAQHVTISNSIGSGDLTGLESSVEELTLSRQALGTVLLKNAPSGLKHVYFSSSSVNVNRARRSDDQVIEKGLPWIAFLPKGCAVDGLKAAITTDGKQLTDEQVAWLADKVGSGRRGLLEIQQYLVDADLGELAKLS